MNKDELLKEMICQVCKYYANVELCIRRANARVKETIRTTKDWDTRSKLMRGLSLKHKHCMWNKAIFDIYKDIKDDEESGY